MTIIPSFNSLNPPNSLNLPYSLPPSSSITSPLSFSFFTVKNFTFHHRCKKFLNQPPFSSSSTSSSLSPLQSAGYSLPAPSEKIYGNNLDVAAQCDKATIRNGNLYLADVTNFDVRGHINVGFLHSDKTYVAVFEVEGVYTDVKIAVYDSSGKEIKNATKTYSNNKSSRYNILLKTGPFKKPTSGDKLTVRLVRRGKTCLKSITIKHITLHEYRSGGKN